MNIDKVTVGLVIYKEKEELQSVLSDLKNQNAYQSIGEVLIVQNSNCEQTFNVAQSFLNQLPLKIFTNQPNNIGQSRSLIVKKSQYPLIAFTDGDCRLPKNWLKNLLNHWQSHLLEHKVALAGPNRLPENDWWQKMVNLSLSLPIGHAWSPQSWIPPHPVPTYHIPTTNGLFLREHILKAGNFSKSNHNNVGEDLDLGLRLKKFGTLYLLPTPIVENNYATSYFETLKRLFQFGQARTKYKNLLSFLTLLFLPLLLTTCILSHFEPLFLIGPTLYLFILFLGSVYVYFKHKNPFSFLLSFFWFVQHFSYSLGALFHLLQRFFSYKKRINSQKITHPK